MALAEEFALLFVIVDCGAFGRGRLFLTLREAPVNGATIFDLDLTLFDLRFLNLVLGKSGSRNGYGQASGRNGGQRGRPYETAQCAEMCRKSRPPS